jgi:hypothetical protein
LHDFCPDEHRLVTNWNGMTYCEPCQISNCRLCEQVELSDETNGHTHVEKREVCIECNSIFQPNDMRDQCIDRYSATKEDIEDKPDEKSKVEKENNSKERGSKS